MIKVGGIQTATLQSKTIVKNSIGEGVETWANVANLKGWLDYSSGEANYQYSAKIQDTTHIFVCDYQQLNVEESQCRLVINNKTYNVLLIDNPMELNYHIEIYLRYIGA